MFEQTSSRLSWPRDGFRLATWQQTLRSKPDGEQRNELRSMRAGQVDRKCKRVPWCGGVLRYASHPAAVMIAICNQDVFTLLDHLLPIENIAFYSVLECHCPHDQ